MIGFLLAKWRGDEARLARGSLSRDSLFRRLKAQRVAIVGNARALSEVRFGSEIDLADIVIRINGAPMPTVASHGTRTDWLAVSTPVSATLLAQRAPQLVLWMTSKRKRLPYRLIRRGEGVYLNRRQERDELVNQIGASPTTGAMIIDLVAKSEAARIDLYGFDFFSSLSLSGRRTAEQVPHDFNAEAAYVHGLIAEDPRITLHAME